MGSLTRSQSIFVQDLRLLLILILAGISAFSQTGMGIGIYPTGTDPGVGIRLSKETRFTLDARLSKINFSSDKHRASTLTSEINLICRIVRLEKVRFHMGLGYRMDYSTGEVTKNGFTIPIGVEAFPFSFQNAGVFFEIAPYCVFDPKYNYAGGLRTVAGFLFYFPTHSTKEQNAKD